MTLSRRPDGHLWLTLCAALLMTCLWTESASGQPYVPSTASAPAASTPSTPASASTTTPATRSPVDPLILAHFYIWFTPTSWNRAKRDLPLAGRYSSDDVDVMRAQVRQAKSVGIDGFIVSWKSTPVLNKRLQALVNVATEEKFKLGITYQGLDFNRAALPAARIAEDLQFLANSYGANPVFDIFGKPMVVLTGTPTMTPATLRSITGPLRKRLLILASDKNVDSYQRIANLVDGNLYYWSSVNPRTFGGYAEKLMALGNAVRASGGIWVAPVAPGFDARLVGGQSAVDRMDGETMRAEWAAAARSVPAAIGIISWNEFSENTHVEPSSAYGQRYLQVIAELAGAPAPTGDLDSSEPAGRGSPLRALAALGAMLLLVLGSSLVLFRRRRQSTRGTVQAS